MVKNEMQCTYLLLVELYCYVVLVSSVLNLCKVHFICNYLHEVFILVAAITM